MFSAKEEMDVFLPIPSFAEISPWNVGHVLAEVCFQGR